MDPKRNFGKKKMVKAASPKIVGNARTEFGTRLCQRVVCTKCGQIDHVSVRVNASKDKLCRSCAEKILAAFDQGRQINGKKLVKACEQCLRDFNIDEAIALKKERLLCIDCLRGFDVWRGKIAFNTNEQKGQVVLTKLGARTTFRKKIHDAI